MWHLHPACSTRDVRVRARGRGGDGPPREHFAAPLAGRYPRFTLIGQSLGSVVLALEALFL